ncbi:MAG: VTT domain-containing protein [Syntrophus sp. (in: bacteria)]
MIDFNKECTGCGACAAVCPFLAEYGTPDLILSEHPEASFYCTSCRQCDAVCPLDLSPAAAFFEAKQRLVQQHQVPVPVRKTLDGARWFAKTGHGFPFSFYGSKGTVFWPGCGLAANRPGLVRKLLKILSSHLRKPVGLVLDCCYDPAYGLGDTETALVALQEIDKRLRDHGVRQVITGCLNCYKLLSQHLEGIQVVFILELLPPDLFEKHWAGPTYLHHPCPSSRWEGIRGVAADSYNNLRKTESFPETDLVKGKDFKSAPCAAAVPINEASDPLCCGAGGGLCSSSPELAGRFLDRIVAKGNGRTMVTYCIGCQNRFLNRGVETVHLLECLPGVTPRRKVSSPLSQWGNRLALATIERLKTGKFLVILIIALLVGGGIYLNQVNVFSATMLVDLLGRHPVLAPLIFLGIYAIAPSLFLPSIPLTLAAGFFWGPVWGVVFAISGATIGACLPFFLSRYLFQGAIKAKAPTERWEWLQDKVIQHGWKAVAFTRLIPVFPFNLLNYLFGLTPIPFRQYFWSTFIFMLPACIAFVAFGSSLGELIMRGNVRGVVIGVVIAIIAFLLPVALRPFFRKIGENETAALPDKSRKEDN